MIWYAVKLLYKMAIAGKPIPELVDDYFNDQDLFFEESILLVVADSFDAAYEKAEAEARRAAEVYTNKYGQIVSKEFYDSIDCFKLSDSPQQLTEVYSTIFCSDMPGRSGPVIKRRYESCSAEQMHVLRQK